MNHSWFNSWRAPIFASLIKSRRDGLLLSGIGAFLLGLHLVGLSAWPCPIKATLGVPCPGCGLTEAIGQLLHGDWRAALSTHAFAPVFLLAFVLLLATSLLPETQRQLSISWISSLEKRTGITAWVLCSLMIYWVFRLFGLV